LPVIPLKTAYAALIDDTGDLNLKNNDPVTMSPPPGTFPNPIPDYGQVVFSGKWNVYVNGKLAGYDKVVKHLYKPSKKADQYNFVQFNKIDQWVSVFDGDPTFVNANKNNFKVIISGSQRIFLRYLLSLCGAYVENWEVTGFEAITGNVYVRTTPRPTANISVPQSVKEGTPVNITLSGQTFAQVDSQVAEEVGISPKQVTVSFNIDGQPVFSGKTIKNTNTYSETITRTFSAGTHTLTLFVKDAVNRYTRKDVTINVQGKTPPPPPAGNINADLKMTLNPPALKTGTTGDINVSLDATGCTSTGSGPFAYRWWVKLNNTYITPSDGINPNNGSPYFSIVAKNAKPGDVIWAKVKVYDYSLNKSSEAETQRTVLEEGVEPPEEPEPEPEPGPTNIPPVAKFKMPSRTGQGTTVNVVNQSYDPDGEIVDVEWDISPRSGVDDSLSFDGGTITFNETGTYEVTLTVTDDFGDSDSTTKTIEVTNEPPVAVIVAPTEVIQGYDVVIRSDSYDPDGEIAVHRWSVSPSTGVMGTLEGEKSTIWFDKPGEYTISLTVEDEFGLEDTTQKTIIVKPAIPVAYFDYSGTLKENRKIVLDASGSRTSERYPMVWEATEWQIIPPAGGSSADIKTVSSPDMKNRTVLFKKAGDYKVRVRVKNSAGHYSEWYERTLSIAPDLPPVADFFVMATVLRDPQNANKAKIELIDTSYSVDGDYISQRIWRYKYDSNNDGNFDDENWITLDSGNNINPVLYTTQVGKYLFELSIKEEFGEETIPEFISPSDYRTDDTSDKPVNDKICEVINLQPVVDFEVLKKPKVDVVFTVGKADSSKTQNLNSKINSIVQTKLAAKNIDARIEAIETATTSTQTQDPSLIFSNWVSFYVGGSGTPPSNAWSYDASLNAVVCNISSRPAVGWYNPNAFSTKDLTVNYKLGIRNDANDFEHGEMGFMFRMKDVNNYYVYIIDNHDACGNVRYDQRSVLAKVVNGNFQVIETGRSFPYFYRGQTWNVRIEAKGNNIKIYRDGSLDIEWTDTDPNYYSQGSYGFYVWDQPSAYFKDIQITTESIKTLDEALKTTTWRDNSIRFLVNISDVELPELNDPVKLGDILSRTLSTDAYFVGLGTDTNRAQYQTFIARNDGKGTFFYNTNMDTALNQTADYIISVIESIPKLLEQYVLLGEEVTYNTYYSDPENDPKYQERWIYQHDPNYFENSLGLASFNGQYLSAPVTVFDKVGKYEVQFQARDNPKADDRFDNYRLWSYMPLNKLVLYVHRKPIAQFAVSMVPSGENYVISITDQSYDLDHISMPNKGIQAWEWKWKEVNETTWHSGKMSGTFPVGRTYIIYLRVQDIEGAWSDPKVQVITTQNINLPPVAQFTVNPATQVINKPLNITDLSYDPNGDPIAERSWRVQKPDGTWINYGSTLPTNIPSLGVGTYTIELKVRDNPKFGTPLWSEPYTQTVTIIPDNNKPVARFTIGPNPVVADEPYVLNDTSYDPDGDPIVAREWKVQKPDGSWVTINQWKPTFDEMGLGDDGTYKIQLRVLDDPSRRHPALTPMWSDPYTVTVQVQGRLIVIGDSNKTTYRAGEAMILTARTEGKAYKVEAKMWYPKNEFTSSNVTTLVPDTPLTSPPQDVMTWHTKHTKAEGRDVVVIIPKNMPDGNYQVVFTAYKQLAGGGTKTATDTITVRVKGTIYDHSKSQIIGPRF